jgi:hypothetical protein
MGFCYGESVSSKIRLYPKSVVKEPTTKNWAAFPTELDYKGALKQMPSDKEAGYFMTCVIEVESDLLGQTFYDQLPDVEVSLKLQPTRRCLGFIQNQHERWVDQQCVEVMVSFVQGKPQKGVSMSTNGKVLTLDGKIVAEHMANDQLGDFIFLPYSKKMEKSPLLKDLVSIANKKRLEVSDGYRVMKRDGTWTLTH